MRTRNGGRLLTVALVLAVAACGSGGAETPEAGSTTSTTVPDPAADLVAVTEDDFTIEVPSWMERDRRGAWSGRGETISVTVTDGAPLAERVRWHHLAVSEGCIEGPFSLTARQGPEGTVYLAEQREDESGPVDSTHHLYGEDGRVWTIATVDLGTPSGLAAVLERVVDSFAPTGGALRRDDDPEAVVAEARANLPGCDDDERPDPTTPTTTTPAGPPYSTAPLHLTTEDGWIYRFGPTLDAVHGTFSKSVVDSPPGEARLVVDLDLPAVFGWTFTGDTPGRNPPPPRAPDITLMWPLPPSDHDLSGTFTVGDLSCQRVGPGLSSPSWPAPEGWTCTFPAEAFDDGSLTLDGYRGETGDLREAAVDFLVSTLAGAEPIVLATLSRSCPARAFFFPDGRVELPHGEDCSLVPA